jgi:hypothetical protein
VKTIQRILLRHLAAAIAALRQLLRPLELRQERVEPSRFCFFNFGVGQMPAMPRPTSLHQQLANHKGNVPTTDPHAVSLFQRLGCLQIGQGLRKGSLVLLLLLLLELLLLLLLVWLSGGGCGARFVVAHVGDGG